jgi:predicted secreted protein
MRKTILFFLLSFAGISLLFAGDTARFLNLGFSDDSRYFMFGQYGITYGTSKPFADCYIIDVDRNDFVPHGKFSENFETKQEAGNDGLGGMFKIVEKNRAQLQSYKINHLLTGRIVYVLIDGQIPISSLEFRDFSSGTLYKVKLQQTQKGTGSEVSSSFSIEVLVSTSSGKKTTYLIGHPELSRKGVKEYRIKYLLLAPDGKSLVFVLEKSLSESNGESIRYMVETKRISNN